MNLNKLKQEISQKNFSHLYYIYGDEPYLKHFYIEELKKALFDEESIKTDLVVLRSDETTFQTFHQHLDSFPMMAAKKMILVIDPSEEDILFKDFVLNPPQLNDETVLVFYAQTKNISKTTAVGKKVIEYINQSGLYVEINHLDDPTLKKWIHKQLKLRNRDISSKNSEYLLETVGPDMFGLIGDIGKLASYSDSEVMSSDIDEVCVKSVFVKVYEITDAILNKNVQKAYLLTENNLVSDADNYILLATLFNFAANLYKIKVLSEQNYPYPKIRDMLGMKDYTAKKYYVALDKIPATRVCELIDKCINAELMLKSSYMDIKTILLQLIQELAL